MNWGGLLGAPALRSDSTELGPCYTFTVSTARKISPGSSPKKASLREVVQALKKAPRRKTSLTPEQLEDVRDGERYRKSGRKGISLDEAEAILRNSK